MQAKPSPSWRATSAPKTLPHCVFVTGPRDAGKIHWLQQQIRDITVNQPDARCAVLLAEERPTRMEEFAKDNPSVTVRRILLPCICCPILADLPGALRALVAAGSTDSLFVEVPAMAAAALVAEFDCVLGWPRKLVVCLDRAWMKALQEQALSLFQMVLLELADRVVARPTPPGIHCASMRSAASAPGAVVDSV